MRNLRRLLLMIVLLGTYSMFSQVNSNNTTEPADEKKSANILYEMSSVSNSVDGDGVEDRTTGTTEYSMSTKNNAALESESNQQEVDPAMVEVKISMKSVDSSSIKKTRFRKEH
ncbi:MAG: hypothetical protein KJO05_11455 [Bacteroidia bacterium]|nr:hypothetical protein [Bacteroidia bacterium]MBT8274535.1 hypothetical protein [Bacteroidia bacterium]NNJ81655.1 hypothetical protein [Flavobacteriaceae bacterium]NNK54809.1 hypothetical protein [Flavobacteriaceae bacterium]NNM09050.1 hypothetical protein [Flavobacteriaceae bacterium]